MLAKTLGAIFLAFYAIAATADEPVGNGRLTFLFAPYVYHVQDNPDHQNEPWLTGLEWEPRESKLEYGVVNFRNSFNQPSVYAYVGKRWFHDDDGQGVFLNVTAGPLYGYRGQYESKVPFNHNGLAWAIIPGVGYQHGAVEAQIVFLGTAAIMITFGYDLLK